VLAVPDLPADVLPRLFAALRGDAATLCALMNKIYFQDRSDNEYSFLLGLKNLILK